MNWFNNRIRSFLTDVVSLSQRIISTKSSPHPNLRCSAQRTRFYRFYLPVVTNIKIFRPCTYKRNALIKSPFVIFFHCNLSRPTHLALINQKVVAAVTIKQIFCDVAINYVQKENGSINRKQQQRKFLETRFSAANGFCCRWQTLQKCRPTPLSSLTATVRIR